MLLKSIRVLAILSVALCLAPAGAHLFEHVSKMAMLSADYMIVQSIYQGWSLFGIAIFSALVLTAVHAIMRRGERTVFLLSLTAFLCVVATQVIFWSFTYPMNAASNNWTVMPENFEVARRQWEYSHAANAVLTFVALIAIVCAVVTDCGRKANSLDHVTVA